MTPQTKTSGSGLSALGFGLWALGTVALTSACATAPQPERVPTPVRTEKVTPASIERGVRYSAQIYAIFVKDLKLVKWETIETHASHDAPSAPAPTVPPTAPAVAQA